MNIPTPGEHLGTSEFEESFKNQLLDQIKKANESGEHYTYFRFDNWDLYSQRERVINKMLDKGWNIERNSAMLSWIIRW